MNEKYDIGSLVKKEERKSGFKAKVIAPLAAATFLYLASSVPASAQGKYNNDKKAPINISEIFSDWAAMSGIGDAYMIMSNYVILGDGSIVTLDKITYDLTTDPTRNGWIDTNGDGIPDMPPGKAKKLPPPPPYPTGDR